MNLISNIRCMVNASSKGLFLCCLFVFIIASMFCFSLFSKMAQLNTRSMSTNSCSTQMPCTFFDMNNTVEISKSTCEAQTSSAQPDTMVPIPSPEKKGEEAGSSSSDCSEEESGFVAPGEVGSTNTCAQQSCSEPTPEKAEDCDGAREQNEERMEERASAQSDEMVPVSSSEKKEEEAGSSSSDCSEEESGFAAPEEIEPKNTCAQQSCPVPAPDKAEDFGGAREQNEEKMEEDKDCSTSSDTPCQNTAEDAKANIRTGLIKAALYASEKGMIPGEKGSVDPTLQSILESIAPSGKLSGNMFLNALGLETGKDWEEYVSGIMAIGRVYDATHADFSIPWPFVSFLWSYASTFLPDNVKRNCFGMFYCMSRGTNLKAMADLLNCSTETLIKGYKALIETGLVVDNERPNATGGGRPDTSTCFADYMEKICLVSGFPQDNLAEMRRLWEINKAVSVVMQKNNLTEESETKETHVGSGTEETKGSKQNTEEAMGTKQNTEVAMGTEQNTERAMGTEQNTEVANGTEQNTEVANGTEQKDVVIIKGKVQMPEIQDVKKSFDELQSHREKTLGRLDAFLGKLEFKQSYALILDKKIIEEGFSELEHNLCHYEGIQTLCAKGRDTLLDVLMKNISLLERYLAKIDAIFESMDKKSYRLGQPYIINRFKTSLPNKDLRDDLYTLSNAYDEYYAHYSEHQEATESTTGETWKAMPLEPLMEATCHSLNTLLNKIEQSMNEQKSGSSDIWYGFDQTGSLLKTVECLYEEYASSENEDERLCVSSLILTIKMQADKCLGLFTDPDEMDRAKILKASRWMNNVAFEQRIEALQEMLVFFNESEPKEDDAPADNVTEQKPAVDGEDPSAKAASDQTGIDDEEIERKKQEAKAMADAEDKSMEECIKNLKNSLTQGNDNKSNRGRKAKDAAAQKEDERDGGACASKVDGTDDSTCTPKAEEGDPASRIQIAIQKLDGLNEERKAQRKNIPDNADAKVWGSYKQAVHGITSLLMEKQDMFEKTEDGEYRLTFSTAQKIAGQVQSNKFSKAVSQNWKEFEYVLQNWGSTLCPEPEDHFILLEEDVQSRDWYDPDSGFMPLTQVCKILHELWSQGKNIYDIETWIGYIISQDCAKTFGLPTGEGTYCKITGQQFQNALRYLTGFTVSAPVIKTIIRENMNYANRQAKKMDQVGDASPYKDQQYDYIDKCKAEAANPKILVISVDTKASVNIGNFKHDNGQVLCKGRDTYCIVLDHDFPLTMRSLYPNGTPFVDESRLDELAVIRPQGAYCLNDNDGFISLVLNRDTSESMCNFLKIVIDIKKQKMPGLEKVILLADGGGSNKANGITWQNELLKLSDAVGLPIEVHHFPMGCSKHNPVEHFLFGPISQHWKGKPILDIEHLGNYISSTWLNGDKHNKVTCWVDGKKYLTNGEKKNIGIEVPTREKLEAYAMDRIHHPYEKGTDMYKWNYIIYPSNTKVELSAA